MLNIVGKNLITDNDEQHTIILNNTLYLSFVFVLAFALLYLFNW